MATTLRDAEGNILCEREEPDLTPPGGGGASFDGLYPNFDPVAELEADDEEHGIVQYLDIAGPLDRLNIDKPVENLRQITLSIRSISADSGDITLIPSVDGVDQPAVTLPVGTAWEKVTLPLPVTAGAVVLRRDASAGGDTLPVAAVVRNVITWSTK